MSSDPADIKPTVPCPRCGGTSSIPASELRPTERKQCPVVAGGGQPWGEQHHRCPKCAPYGPFGLIPQNEAIIAVVSGEGGYKHKRLLDTKERRQAYMRWLMS